MFGWFKRRKSPRLSARARKARWLRARFDAAQTTDAMRRHWLGAEFLSPDAEASPEVRRILRCRARYEVQNNSYARGIVSTLANYIVGTGPRLQLLTTRPEANAQIEAAFQRWARAVRLPEKLRTMRMAQCQDGEAFAMLTTNPGLSTPVKLDLRLVEADQVTTPDLDPLAENAVDGIVFDPAGNPLEYHVLRVHPGSPQAGLRLDYQRVPAQAMIHLFRAERPGQHRGVPEITPALPLFALLRDYTLATLDAAKAAAYFAGIIYTDSPPGDEPEELEPLDPVELERGALVTMPAGWKMAQLDAKQPPTGYADYKHEIIAEIGRCLNMPYNIAAANSAQLNYSSGRLDWQAFARHVGVEQSHLEQIVLERILAAWLDEAALVPGLLPEGLGPFADWPHQWFWPGFDHVDPAKEAVAQEKRLQNHTTTLAYEYARQGRDWETEIQQRAKELRLMRKLGLSEAEAMTAAHQ